MSPVTVSDLQTYLRDTSVDTNTLDHFGSVIEIATDGVFTYLGRDYIPNAAKKDIFWGNNSDKHRLQYQAGVIASWKYYDKDGVETNPGTGEIELRENGTLIMLSNGTFEPGYEHRVEYTTPASLVCPQAVKQIIIELAAELFHKSNQGQGELFTQVFISKFAERLMPFKRIAV